MRTLAIASLYPLSVGDFAGQPRHVTFRSLCRQGHDVEVFRCQSRLPWLLSRTHRRRGSPHVPKSYRIEGVPVTCPRFFRLPGQWWVPYEGRARYRAIARSAVSRHRGNPFDVVYGCELMPDGVAALRLGRSLNLPVIVSSIGSDAHTYPYYSTAAMRCVQEVVRSADLILVEGEGAADAVQALVHEPLAIRAFSRGIDLTRYRDMPCREAVRKRLGLPAGQRLIVFLGRLLEGKGIRLLIEVFGRLQSRFIDTDLVIIGAGVMGAWLAEQAASGPWGHRIHALGNQPFNEVPHILKACDVFCLPSFAEGLPKSVIEAMAADLPVVATTVGGIPDVVRDGLSGVLIPPRDARALEAALVRMLANPDEAGRMGQVGRGLAYEHYDAEKNAAGFLTLIREAIDRAAARTGSRK